MNSRRFMQPILLLGGESGTRLLSNIDNVSRPKSKVCTYFIHERLADPDHFPTKPPTTGSFVGEWLDHGGHRRNP